MTHYLTAQSVGKRYDCSRSTVWRWVKEGNLPKPVKLATGAARWKLSDLEKWEEVQGVRNE